MPKLKEFQVLRVNIADGAHVHPTDENRKWALEPGERLWVIWHDHKSGPYKKSEEFIATPIATLDVPQDLRVTPSMDSGNMDYSDWYYLERRPKAHGLPNEYIVHADDLIPLDYKYPNIVTGSFLSFLQETLARAQLEAVKLSRTPEIRIGTADRLLNHLRTIGVNVREE